MNISIGYTFLGPQGNPQVKPHYWVVVTEPNTDGDVAIVSYTSNWYDETTILTPQDHEILNRKTFVRYQMACITRVSRIWQIISAGDFVPKSAAPLDTVRRLQDGIIRSKDTQPCVKRFVRELLKQGFNGEGSGP